ncbi:B3 domain-containing protein [Hordeum vulgare]|nr:B3 domain-containing protein [Hordeum vulgare]
MEFFTVILEKSSRMVLLHNFVKMLDGHRPQNMKLRQAGNGIRKLWHVEVVFDTDGRMYLDRGWKHFVRAYDLGIGYFIVLRYDGNATFTVKVFDTTMCRRRYQDDDDAGTLYLFFLSIRLSLTPILKKNFFAFGKAMGAGPASTATGAMSTAATTLAAKVAATLATAKVAATMASRWMSHSWATGPCQLW